MTCGFTPPTDKPERGKPREQYERTYVLLPQDAGEDWAQAVIEATWKGYRFTVGSSADDAGIGDLDCRRVVVVNADRWGTDPRIGTWFDEWYEGVDLIYVNAETPSELVGKLQALFPPPDPPPSPAFSIAGTHDQAGAEWMVSNDVKGWCVIPLYLNTSAIEVAGLQRYKDAGINIILRLNYSYAVDDGGQGTIPAIDKLQDFETACIQTITINPAAWGFVLCNEVNNKREWPKDYVVVPGYYAGFYSRVYNQAHLDRRIAPAAIDPYNPGFGDWRVTWKQVLDGIASVADADFLTFHCYTHGWALPLI